MSKPTANDLYRAAQRYIKEGQPVFPCWSVGTDTVKNPLIPKGVYGATLDKAQAKAWWKRHKNAAIGLPTGILWDVLDVDVKGDTDGRRHLPYLLRLGLLNGCKRIVKTPRGGWHLYFKTVQGLNHNRVSKSLGLDIRTSGGYVLAPPSYLDDGRDVVGSYELFDAPEDSSDDPLLWSAIQSALEPIDTKTKKPVQLLPSERWSSVAAIKEWLSARTVGDRNECLHWSACRFVDMGIDPFELMESSMLSGLQELEITKTINSVLKRAGLVHDDLKSEAEAMFSEE